MDSETSTQVDTSRKHSVLDDKAAEKEHIDNGSDSSLSIPKSLTLTFRNISVQVDAPENALSDTLLTYLDPRHLLGGLGRKNGGDRVRYAFL